VEFIGHSKSGKTTSLITLAQALVRAGWKVGTIKHIHDQSFTIDTKGKDTQLHMLSGASTVVAIAPKELTVIRRKDTEKLTADAILDLFKSDGIDYVLVEGLSKKFSRKRLGLTRILCAYSETDVKEFIRYFPKTRISFISGKVASKSGGKKRILDLPVIDLRKNARDALRYIS
jgi:molybdopterin-guanine dinucleotide biosynthesis protein MobB